jgi:Mn-dependent DtxR family transcriptional regulator
MLKKKNFVIQEPYGHIEMTEEGRKMAIKILNRHNAVTKLFISIGVSPEVAERDACNVEHVISEETFRKILEYNNRK